MARSLRAALADWILPANTQLGGGLDGIADVENGTLVPSHSRGNQFNGRPRRCDARKDPPTGQCLLYQLDNYGVSGARAGFASVGIYPFKPQNSAATGHLHSHILILMAERKHAPTPPGLRITA